jgi:hypothetical protein
MTIPIYPEFEICSRCKENTSFEWDEDSREWLSVCCGAYPISLDDEYDLGYLDVMDPESLEFDNPEDDEL